MQITFASRSPKMCYVMRSLYVLPCTHSLQVVSVLRILFWFSLGVYLILLKENTRGKGIDQRQQNEVAGKADISVP
ncbi:hypothetical protein BDZ91DRAFT_718424 [Kalaharituber pfeilii]|nr:hypothetical protein BDZ91DRAFT_718424 [Kalaharituber pfeilii]